MVEAGQNSGDNGCRRRGVKVGEARGNKQHLFVVLAREGVGPWWLTGGGTEQATSAGGGGGAPMRKRA
jgi:hypothetical protein